MDPHAQMPHNVDYAETPVETTIISNSSATIDELVSIGRSIYKDIMDYCTEKRGVKEIKRVAISLEDCTNRFERLGLISRDKLERPHKPKKVESIYDETNWEELEKDEYTKLVKRLQEKYKDFNASFPVFIRWTVQTGDFHEKALRRYLNDFAKSTLKTENDFFELQRNYVVYLYRALNPHWDTDRVRRLSSDIMNALTREKKEMKEIADEVEKEMDEKAIEIRKFKREALRQYLLKLAAAK